MPPHFDARAALGDAAGLHALIVGVGTYPFLRNGAQAIPDHWDMGQLSSTATSAYRVCEWLLDADAQGRLPVPLATCRLLLSPSPGEQNLPGTVDTATLANFSAAASDWRNDCKDHRENAAFFYFAGHGVQRSPEDAVLCLEGFRQPGLGSLVHSVSLANITGGMAPAPGFHDIARTQMYFLDACRVRPDRLSQFDRMGTTEVFDKSLAAVDDRCAPIFYAALSNQPALAVPGNQTLFSRAILDCLEGEAGEPLGEDPETGEVIWGVTVASLNDQLSTFKIDQLNRDFMGDQAYCPGGLFRPATICRLNEAPDVRFRLEISPPAASQFSRVTLSRPSAGVVYQVAPPVDPHPHEFNLPGGIYRLQVTFDPPRPPYHRAEKFCSLKPARHVQPVRVA